MDMTFRKRIRYNIYGTPISEIENIVAKDLLDKDDYLLISQPDSVADVFNEGYYKSKAISFKAFEKQLSSDILAALGLGSIIYDDPDKYAKAEHKHELYAKITIDSYCSNRRKADNALSSLVTFEVDGISENVSIPDAIGRQQLDGISNIQLAPYVGEMRLFGAETYKKIVSANLLIMDMNNDLFSGWAIPQGQIIDLSRFPLAFKIFNGKLPIIEEYFMKFNPFFYNIANLQDAAAIILASEIPVLSHMHPITNAKIVYNKLSTNAVPKVSFKYTLLSKISKDYTFDWGQATVDNACNNTFEYGYRACTCTAIGVNVTVKARSILDAELMSTAVEESDHSLARYPTIPSLTKVLALVYIGKPFTEEQQPTSTSGSTTSQFKPDNSYEEYTT